MGTFGSIKIAFLLLFTFFLVLQLAVTKNPAAGTTLRSTVPTDSTPADGTGSQDNRVENQCDCKKNHTCQNMCNGKNNSGRPPNGSPTSSPSPSPSPSLPRSPHPSSPKPDKYPPSPANPNPPQERKQSGVKQMVYVLTSIPAGVLVLGLIFILIFWHKKSRAVKPLEASWNGQPHASSIGLQLFKRSELESACECFSNIIGLVSDGPLYKGTLPSGIEISVSSIKQDKALRKPFETQFWKKISVLSKISHKNFVNLLGYCEEELLTRMLVFEYAPNGTLFEHLHASESLCLGWAARMRIAMGIAYCLEHMHQLNPPIILKNLDTSLIYLTDDYAAKVADFEFWSGTAEGGIVVGPSMALLQEVPDKGSIVQQFGIVLLELLSGRDPSSEHSGPTAIWAWDLLNVDTPLKDMIDPELKSFPEDRAAAVFQLIKQCLNPNPEQVLSMKEVTAQLKEITSISPKSAAPLGYDLDIVSEGTAS